MTSIFIIAECGSNWRFRSPEPHHHGPECACEKDNAYRMIRAAKECGADAAKFQWVSDYKMLMARRGASPAEEGAYQYVPFPREWLALLKAECDRVGIEFMCTTYLIEDVAVVRPFVKHMKVAAKESEWTEFKFANREAMGNEIGSVIVSTVDGHIGGHHAYQWLHCVSKYPTSIDEIRLGACRNLHGLSDHTANVLTGAVAVGAGARIIESHVRLHDTPESCPDYGHSLVLDNVKWVDEKTMFEGSPVEMLGNSYWYYVKAIRLAERML